MVKKVVIAVEREKGRVTIFELTSEDVKTILGGWSDEAEIEQVLEEVKRKIEEVLKEYKEGI